MDQAAVRVTNLRKSYGEVHAVDGVTFVVPAAHVFTLLGPNGAGKTTTLEILEGIRDADEGEIEVLGQRVRRIDRTIKERMGVLLQEGNFEPYLRVKEVLRLFASFFHSPRSPSEVLREVSLEEKANAYVKTLSGGQRQRLALGVALINDPDLIFLDEPTTGLDPQARRNIWSLVTGLTDAGKTIILTTHYMEEAESLSHLVCIMDHGRLIAQGSPRELAAQLGRETLIEFVAQAGVAPSPEFLGPACKAVRRDGDLILVETGDLVATMARLLEWSAAAASPLAGMTVRQPNLEDVFLSMTGRRLRE
ncbi:MAG: ABC transporter ATP-binding protein [Candidatus Bipolaricaulota bacterium]|nr:ABC transporter ATP-binding protein [Candidatus Bipolaricaulota bacterium]